jgi:cob(I)alamin adenosyltransferase
LRGGRPRLFARVSVSDLQRLRERADELAQDMNARKGAYIHAGGEAYALLSVAREIADAYLSKEEPA